jgi:ActR/RegA family two-component response regulator
MTTPSLAVLIVDDEPNIRKTLAIALEAEGHRVLAVSNFKDALAEAARQFFDLALVDLRLGTESGLELIPTLRTNCPWMKVVVITAYASIDTAVEAMRRGAYDYLPKPFTPDQVILLMGKIAEVRTLEARVAALQEALNEAAPEADLASRSPAMQQALAIAQRVAAAPPGTLASSPVRRCRRSFWKASSSAMSKGPSPARCGINWEGWRPVKAAPCSWMKSETYPCCCKPSCCECSRIRSTNGWATWKPARPTCASSRPPA